MEMRTLLYGSRALSNFKKYLSLEYNGQARNPAEKYLTAKLTESNFIKDSNEIVIEGSLILLFSQRGEPTQIEWAPYWAAAYTNRLSLEDHHLVSRGMAQRFMQSL